MPLASVPERVEAPSTDKVPATAVLPDALATVNLSVLTSKFPSIPVAPVTPNVVSKVTASSTFNVPFTVVITPEEATLTTPPPDAKVVAPDDVNVVNTPVEAEVAPIVVPSIVPPSIFAEELIAFI